LGVINVERLKVPLPFALRYVNSYIFVESEGLTIVDPGLHTADTEQTWQAWLDERGFTWASIRRIVLTHHHPDHYGYAGRMQQLSGGAPVWMARKSHVQTQRIWAGERDLAIAQFAGFQRHGLPEVSWQPMRDHMDSYLPQVSPHPEVRYMEPGETVRMGGGSWLAYEMSGHAFGQLVFYEPTTKQMIIGDHVLPQITPNVAYLPEIDENPLATFIEALEAIQKVEISIAYPGHRDPFEGVAERAQYIIDHHLERLQKMLALFEGDAGLSAHDVCIGIFGDKLGVHQMRFALSETIAHLYYLVSRGQVVEVVDAHGQIRFQRVA
jgi:glyoxylase-like metal-dependent hydrolase (beta-lactamase superfamily II)